MMTRSTLKLVRKGVRLPKIKLPFQNIGLVYTVRHVRLKSTMGQYAYIKTPAAFTACNFEYQRQGIP